MLIQPARAAPNLQILEPQLAPLDRLTRNQIIRKIACQILAELAISLAIGAIVCTFIPSQVGVAVVLGGAVVQCMINFFARMTGAFAEQKALQNGVQAGKYKTIARVCSYIAPSVFWAGTAVNGQRLIHEAGHALA